MSEEQLKELQEYNLEYLEAQQSEEIFGGDYTSAVELKYAKKEIKRLENIIKEVREYITSQKLHKIQDTTGGLTYQEIKLLEILDKENKQ